MASPQRIATFTIPNGGTDSNVVSRDAFGRCRSLEIACTAAALTGVCTVQSNDQADGSGTWVTVQSPPGTDVAIAALKGVVLTAMPFMALRIHSASAEGAQRVFEATGDVGQ